MTDKKMNNRKKTQGKIPKMAGTGLAVLDIIQVRGESAPRYQAGGTCANVTAILAYLGWNCRLYSRIAGDWAGQRLIKDLSQYGVACDSLTSDLAETPKIVEKLNPSTGKHHFRFNCPACGRYFPRYRSLTIEQSKLADSSLQDAKVFFFDRISPANLRLARLAKNEGCLAVFEPSMIKPDPQFQEAVRMSHIVKYSHQQTTDGLRSVLPEEDMPLLEIETLGSEGVRYRISGKKRWFPALPSNDIRPVDTTGAGDWLTASFVYALEQQCISLVDELTNKKRIRDALVWSQLLAAHNCQYVGAHGTMAELTPDKLIRHAEAGMALPSDIITDISGDFLPHREKHCSICRAPLKREAKNSVEFIPCHDTAVL